MHTSTSSVCRWSLSININKPTVRCCFVHCVYLKVNALDHSAAYQNMSSFKDAIFSFTPVATKPLLHKCFIDRLLFFFFFSELASKWQQTPVLDWMICTRDSIRLLSSCARVQELDSENNGACRSPMMDGCSDEVMLCIPDESSGSADRIYVTVKEQPLWKMLSVWSSCPRPFVIVIDGLPVIKLTCWQTLICFIS